MKTRENRPATRQVKPYWKPPILEQIPHLPLKRVKVPVQLKLGLPQHEMQMLATEASVIHTAGFLQLFLPKAQPPPLA